MIFSMRTAEILHYGRTSFIPACLADTRKATTFAEATFYAHRHHAKATRLVALGDQETRDQQRLDFAATHHDAGCCCMLCTVNEARWNEIEYAHEG